MATETNEALKLILYIEEHLDVLIKSQIREEKQKKSDAADNIIKKWKDLTGKPLTQATLFKKINNIKARAKSALTRGKPLNKWQKKILEIAGADIDIESDESHRKNDCTAFNGSSGNTSDAAKDGLSNGVKILNKYESEETKALSNEQLHRLVLLKQVQVLNLQQQRLEQLNGQVEVVKDVVFDFVDFDRGNAEPL